ncbi:hypothetical protein MMC15_005436 [Xylographa vitiligo]|nr:hypothetical protein [Xylographa vitiligo]
MGTLEPDFRGTFHITIIGGGLAGLVAAIALAKSGYKVTILERDGELREWGAGIQIPSNCAKVLRQIGILDQVRARSTQPRTHSVLSYKSGATLSKQDMIPMIEMVFGAPHLVIHRAVFQRVLVEQVETLSAINIQLGAIIDPVLSDFAQGSICFSVDGSESKAVTTDLIIGADGERSMCREILLGRPDPPKLSGYVAYRSLIEGSRILEAPETSIHGLVNDPGVNVWQGPESHAVSYMLDGMLNLVLFKPSASNNGGASSLKPELVGGEELRSQFVEWEPRIQALLKLVTDCIKWEILETEELKEWVHPNGHFVLLGDSAHAMLPFLSQGAAMALESASFLCNLLSKATSPMQIAPLLQIWNKQRELRVRKVVEGSKTMGRFWHSPNMAGLPEASRPKNVLADPQFQMWLLGYDVGEDAQKAWEVFQNPSLSS